MADSVPNLEHRAAIFATEAHSRAKQVRKYTGLPYITHPMAVVSILRAVPHTTEMLAAAWLHDTVEDTGTELSEIESVFGKEVAELVGWLTDVSKPSDGNRAARKALDLVHTAKAPPQAKTIKLADLIDNSLSITDFDADFAKVYMREKEKLLPFLKSGDPQLWGRANHIVETYLKLQEEP